MLFDRSTTPHFPRSFPPPSFASLPTEILTHILEEIPYHPSKHRSASLARTCLVNKNFFSIAQPLLYRQVHLNFDEDYDESDTTIYRLLGTLVNVNRCANLVKRVRISMDDMSNLEITTLAYLLSQLKSLESIQTGDIEDEHQADFVRAILKHQSSVKHLELRNLALDWRFLNHFGALKTLIGRFDPEEVDASSLHGVNVTSKLDRFVSYSPLTKNTLERILHSSWSSLSSLAFAVDPEHAHLNLQRIENLNTLRIVVEDDADFILKPLEAGASASEEAKRSTVIDLFVKQIRSILRSAQSLPIKILSITVEDPYIPDILAPHLLLDLLPPSLRHFGSILELLEPDSINYPEIETAVRDRRQSHLEKITIFPSVGYGEYDWPRLDTDEARRRFSEFEREFQVEVGWYGSGPGVKSPWYTIEPYYEESEDEEDAEGAGSGQSSSVELESDDT